MTAPLQPDPLVVYHDLLPEEGGVLLHLETGSYHSLNPTGAAIWRLLDGSRRPDDIAAALRVEMPDAPDDLASVVVAFLADLRDRGLIVTPS